ncbi:phosphatidate cytidylyltransferase [Sphingomonas xinjiangensis]|uniref:Phosphatidate cytidylyltransferase n=1 Tax=Sphingomonas xinjiangensis TaxID=643568 RepID=A0A840YP94_9SPHN|nr:phosphatidate cytidylyltransferase [Sphingomonas xinjiangensis]
MSSKTSDLGTRAIVGVALVGLAAVALWAGGLGFWLILSVAGILMMGEWAGLTGATPRQRRLAQYTMCVPFAVMAPDVAAGPSFLALGLLVGAVLFLGAATPRPRLAFGALYVGLPVFALLMLRERQDNGLLLTFWAMALVWACDTGAYFAGRTIGGPKLAPRISPNKTWAGFIGGLIAGTAFAFILVRLFDLPLTLALATPLLGALSQAGDLYESHLKRRAGVKDSSNLLPGHGGVLDRLDGLVFVAPVAALLVFALAR